MVIPPEVINRVKDAFFIHKLSKLAIARENKISVRTVFSIIDDAKNGRVRERKKYDSSGRQILTQQNLMDIKHFLTEVKTNATLAEISKACKLPPVSVSAVSRFLKKNGIEKPIFSRKGMKLKSKPVQQTFDETISNFDESSLQSIDSESLKQKQDEINDEIGDEVSDEINEEINEEIDFIETSVSPFEQMDQSYVDQLQEYKDVAVNMANQISDLDRQMAEMKEKLSSIVNCKSKGRPPKIVAQKEKEIRDLKSENTSECMNIIEMLRKLDHNLSVLIEKVHIGDVEGSKPYVPDSLTVENSNAIEKNVILAMERKIELLTMKLDSR